MRVEHLPGGNAFIAYDFDDARTSAGGTRYAADVTEQEAGLLARAMTYKFAAIERSVGGAKGAVRGTPDEQPAKMAAYCEAIKPLVASATFLTGPDLGTCEADFAPIRDRSRPASVMASSIAGRPIEDLITGFGVVAAAEAATGNVDHMRFAIEGFGKVGGGVAREAARRGSSVVAISTVQGAVFNPHGFDVEQLLAIRSAYGDALVHHIGGRFDPDPRALFEADADILVPGARCGVIDAEVAGVVRTRWIAPAANVPYTRDAVDVMRTRRINFLPDFVCNAGATIGYSSNIGDVSELFKHVDRTISSLISRASADPRGPFDGACAIAEAFMATWRGNDGLPEGPPLAD